jgi:hypothetical protein
MRIEERKKMWIWAQIERRLSNLNGFLGPRWRPGAVSRGVFIMEVLARDETVCISVMNSWIATYEWLPVTSRLHNNPP